MISGLLGALGEQEAARFLRKKGCRILSANYKTPTAEIDIVALDGKYICFVEVKTRQKGGLVPAADAVDLKKQDNIRRGAASYMNRYKYEYEVRFDIIEVYVNGSTVVSVNHIPFAF